MSARADASRRTASTGRRHSSTREMLLRMVESLRDPVSTSALAEAAGLHENTVRGHLEKLLADGFVSRAAAPADGRGRPAWLWRAQVDATAAPYVVLAGVLAEALARTSPDPVADARAAGRRWGKELAAADEDGKSDPRGTVIEAMRGAGFDPRDSGSHVQLRRCPLVEAAVKHPSIVCPMHQGMVDGVLEATGGGAAAELEPFTSPGVCTLTVQAASGSEAC